MKKRLALKKITIRDLDDSRLDQLAGGGASAACTNTCNCTNTCPGTTCSNCNTGSSPADTCSSTCPSTCAYTCNCSTMRATGCNTQMAGCC